MTVDLRLRTIISDVHAMASTKLSQLSLKPRMATNTGHRWSLGTASRMRDHHCFEAVARCCPFEQDSDGNMALPIDWLVALFDEEEVSTASTKWLEVEGPHLAAYLILSSLRAVLRFIRTSRCCRFVVTIPFERTVGPHA